MTITICAIDTLLSENVKICKIWLNFQGGTHYQIPNFFIKEKKKEEKKNKAKETHLNTVLIQIKHFISIK